MTCGNTQNLWITPIVGSIWSGSFTDTGQSIVSVLSPAANLATVVVDGIPLAGTWTFLDGLMLVEVATEGITYDIRIYGTTCTATQVTVIGGSGIDNASAEHPTVWNRVL